MRNKICSNPPLPFGSCGLPRLARPPAAASGWRPPGSEVVSACRQGMAVAPTCGCFYKFRILFVGLPVIRALLFWVYSRAPCSWKLPCTSRSDKLTQNHLDTIYHSLDKVAKTKIGVTLDERDMQGCPGMLENALPPVTWIHSVDIRIYALYIHTHVHVCMCMCM